MGWSGASVRPRTWQECRDLACFIGGPNPALRDDQPYSQAHYDSVCAALGDPAVLDKYLLIFVDSIKRVIFGLIGLHSSKGPEWANIGRSFLRAMLNSARGMHPADNSQQAQNARRIRGFGDLDGLTFAAKVEIEKDQNNEERNVIKAVIQPDHKEYASVMGGTPTAQAPVPQSSPTQAVQPSSNGFSMPAWAK